MKKKLLVSIESEAKIQDVARKLAGAGMDIEEKDGAFGLITGSAEQADLVSLKRVAGVRHVEEQRSFETPEKGASVQ